MSREDLEGLISSISKAGRMEIQRIEVLFSFTNMDDKAKSYVKEALELRKKKLPEISEGERMAISSELSDGERESL